MNLAMYLEATRRFNEQTQVTVKRLWPDGSYVVSTGLFAGTHGIDPDPDFGSPYPARKLTMWLRDQKTGEISATVPVDGDIIELHYEKPTALDNLDAIIEQRINAHLSRLEVKVPTIRSLLAGYARQFLVRMTNKLKP